MAAKYVKLNRVGNLNADFNKFHLFKLSEIYTIFLRNINKFISVEKSNKYFVIKNYKNPVYYRNCIGHTHVLAIELILQ